MSEPFVGEIRMFAGNFAPRNWAFCDGQLLAVSQNDALFSLLGIIYGGDGRNTFGLPDLRGRLAMHRGQGPGLMTRLLGAKGGTEKETLSGTKLPAHSHEVQGSAAPAGSKSPSNGQFATAGAASYTPRNGAKVTMSPSGVESTGSGWSHGNMMPALCINFIIALVGVYPSRS